MSRFFQTLLMGFTLFNLAFTPFPQIEDNYDPVVAQMLTESQSNRWVDWIAALSGEVPVRTADGEGRILTRSSYVLFEPEPAPSAFTYLQEELIRLGFTEGRDYFIHTYDFPFGDRHPQRNWKNLILTIPGTHPVLKNERVLLVAHLDSTSGQEWTLAPGADDNASGSAGLLEAAALFRRYRFDRTIHLVWFSGEEQSRRGSESFVIDYANWLPEIVGVINLDMFAFDWDNDRCFEVHAGTLPGSQTIGDSFADVIDAYGLDLRFDFIDDETAYTLSDHNAFWEKDIPAVMIFENGFYQEGKTCGVSDRNTAYHTTADTLTYINQSTGFSILQASIAVIAHMAGPNGACFQSAPEIEIRADHYHRYLVWEPLPDAVEYQIWIRDLLGWHLRGTTVNNSWAIKNDHSFGITRIKVIAITNDGCQSQPMYFPLK